MTPDATQPRLVALGKKMSRVARRVPVAATLILWARRNARRALLNLMPTGSVCAEIGVWKGQFSQQILEVVRPKVLHLIDPWRYAEDNGNLWHGVAADMPANKPTWIAFTSK